MSNAKALDASKKYIKYKTDLLRIASNSQAIVETENQVKGFLSALTTVLDLSEKELNEIQDDFYVVVEETRKSLMLRDTEIMCIHMRLVDSGEKIESTASFELWKSETECFKRSIIGQFDIHTFMMLDHCFTRVHVKKIRELSMQSFKKDA
jgi:hypothetical protein